MPSKKKTAAIVALSGIGIYLIKNRRQIAIGYHLQKDFPEFTPTINVKAFHRVAARAAAGEFGEIDDMTDNDFRLAFLKEAYALQNAK